MLLCPQNNWQCGRANWESAQFPDTWKHQLPQIIAECMRSFERQHKKFCSRAAAVVVGRFLVTSEFTQEMKGFLSASIRLKKYDWSLFHLFLFLSRSQSYLFPFFTCLFYYIAQFLVLAIWIKIPINISLKTEKKKDSRALQLFRGFGARSVAGSVEQC